MTKLLIASLTTCLVAASLWAQDTEEIIVLDAESLARNHRDLAERLAETTPDSREEYVLGAMGAPPPLPESDDRNHLLNIVHRSGYSWAESHDSLTDFYIVTDGAGTLLLGGTMVDAIEVDGRPGEWRSPALEQARPYELSKGDMINIPSRIPHQWELADDESVTYVIVKVRDKPDSSTKDGSTSESLSSHR